MTINYLAIFVAAIASWLAGAAWYGALGKQWQAALARPVEGKTAEGGARSIPIRPMIIAFAALLLMAYMLAGIIGHVGGPSIRVGAEAGALTWLGFTITAITVNNAFQKQKPMLTVIDGGHWLAVLVIQGAIIGAFG